MQWNRYVNSGICVGLLALLCLMAGCFPGDPSLTPSTKTTPAPEFVGNAVCAECHPNESAIHQQSRHAITLNALSQESLGKLAPPVGPIPGTGFVLEKDKDLFRVGFPTQSSEIVPLNFAVGSGKSGVTYVAFLEDEKLAEFRMSYFPSKKKWYITPGQERLAADSLGKVHSQANARRCMQCHSVTLPPEKSLPEKRFFGVGCESCHGPGGAHVRSAREGKFDQNRMEKLGKLPATQLNNLCGKCHGTKAEIEAAHLPKDVTNRMQTYGLMESKCFQKSQDTLSCLSCHAPHENARKEPKYYERACLKCHSGPATTNRTCPVNPKEKCIGCHMPERKALSGSDIPMTMADHKIHIPAPKM